MKKTFANVLISVFILNCLIFNGYAGVKIVVLGSSTAAGYGPKNINNAWVNRYRMYLITQDTLNEVVNLASLGGYCTYRIMPTNFIPPSNRILYLPDTARNISKALSLHPQAIIINMPTNDVSYGFSTTEQMSNYSVIVALAAKSNVPVWIATSQPRNLNTASRDSLILLKTKILNDFDDKAIDFWTTFANDDGTIKTLYDSGDGIHLNDSAHAILFQQVVGANIPFVVQKPITGIVLNKCEITINNVLGDSIKSTVLTNDNILNQVIWNSSDATIAFVDNNGFVVPVKTGNVDITASTPDDVYKATCHVEINNLFLVTEELNTYFENITIYPTTDNHIYIKGLIIDDKINIYNIAGNLIKREFFPQSTLSKINVEEFPKGIYMIQIVRKKEIVTKKFIRL